MASLTKQLSVFLGAVFMYAIMIDATSFLHKKKLVRPSRMQAGFKASKQGRIRNASYVTWNGYLLTSCALRRLSTKLWKT